MRATATTETARWRIAVDGAVQGVGFRPFVARLARSFGLGGSVHNAGWGATVEVEGPPATLPGFVQALRARLPEPGSIAALEVTPVPVRHTTAFAIADSKGVPAGAWVLPDQATCPACLAELRDPGDRRCGYPFINCTRCGPRYSILARLPYDRLHTTMAAFSMCPACRAEYDDPGSRRYHAQPNACPDCGPQLRLSGADGEVLARAGEVIDAAVAAIAAGRIVAVKGLGGFHLVVDAGDDEAVARLRERKARTSKPLAVMVADVDWARRLCRVGVSEAGVLGSAAAPIVLLRRRGDHDRDHDVIARGVAPGCADLGVMLPYTPLHHLLLSRLGRAVVATSGNLSEEPICTDDEEARVRLGRIADLWIGHDRGIARACEDSVVTVIAGRPMVLRRGRGLAPAPVASVRSPAEPSAVVAVGGHLANTVAIAVGGRVVLSPHVGDLDGPRTRAHQRCVAEDLCALYDVPVRTVVTDRHPDYGSRPLADEFGARLGTRPVEVGHHAAHLWACLADNDAVPPCVGVVWDGMGLGGDRTLWGGELLLATAAGGRRVGHLRTFGLIGADAADRDTRRAALGALYEALPEGEAIAAMGPRLSTQQARVWGSALGDRSRRGPGRSVATTSSAGRLFDAVASILDVAQRNDYEGHAPSRLEAQARELEAEPYALEISRPDDRLVVDWTPMLRAVVADRDRGVPVPIIAARFHATMVQAIVSSAAAVAQKAGVQTVALSGGCFANRILLEGAVLGLRGAGLRPLWPRDVPPGDGGLAVGQVVAAMNGEAR